MFLGQKSEMSEIIKLTETKFFQRRMSQTDIVVQYLELLAKTEQSQRRSPLCAK